MTMNVKGVVLSLLFIGLTGTTVAAHPATYRIRSGETLWSIATARGVSAQYLACLNGIRNVKRLRPGQRIILPHRPTGSMRLKLAWPLQTGRLTSRFGPRRRRCHTGIDIAASIGTPVRAAASGRVVFSGRRRGYGNLVIIEHSNVYKTAYAHLQTRAVRKGQRVRKGKVLATVGRSGRATGPHLHFEVLVRNQARDPLFYLPPPAPAAPLEITGRRPRPTPTLRARRKKPRPVRHFRRRRWARAFIAESGIPANLNLRVMSITSCNSLGLVMYMLGECQDNERC